MEETPIFDFPFPEPTDKPDGAEQIELLALKVEERLAMIEQLLLGAPAPGNLIVVNGTSDPVYKAATGDVTNNSAGVFTIGEEKVATTMVKNLAVTAAKLAEEAVETAKLKNLNVTEGKLANLAVAAGKLAAEAVETGKIKALAVTEAKLAAEAVTTAKLANGAVTSPKFKPTAGLKEASGAVETTEVLKDVPGCLLEITPTVASILRVVGVVNKSLEGSGEGSLLVDGVAQTARIMWQSGQASATNYSQVWDIALTAALHTIKLQVRRTTATAVNVNAVHTRFVYDLRSS